MFQSVLHCRLPLVLDAAGSMYAQLRTNLPREVMGFQAFPFDKAWRGSKDPRQFCEHAEVRLLQIAGAAMQARACY